MSAHTRTPWMIDGARLQMPFDGHVYISGAGNGIQGMGYVVAMALGQTHTSASEAEANAAFIVRACNSFEALVGALRAAGNALSELATSLPGGQAQVFADNAADAVSAELRKLAALTHSTGSKT